MREKVLVPTGPVAVNLTVFVEALRNVCVRLVAVVLVVVPSPKSQKRLVIVPVELSVKATAKGLGPLVGAPTNVACGTLAPVPRTVFVAFPPLPELKTTTLLKLAALVGAKRITTLVEPNPARANGVPDKMVKGGVAETVPLDKEVPPRFVTVKLACEFEPIATVPKFKLVGETASWAGVSPEPVTVLVLLPPLLVKSTTLLKLPAEIGLKVTPTDPV